ncbi:hypothetical protein ACROYT_G016044 [Oculina patagonica]
MDSGRRKVDNGFQTWPEESRKHWIVAMFCGTLLLYAARSAIPLCLAAMSSDMNWDKEIDGAIMSAFFWGYMPAQVVGGYLSDKYGGEVILGLAAVVWSLLTLAVPFLPVSPILFVSPTMIIIAARMCTGLSQGLHYPSLTNIIAKRIPIKDRTFLTSTIFAGGPVGTLFMGSVGSIFLAQFGWHSVFIFHGLMALLWAYLWRFHLVLPEQHQRREQLALGNIKMVEASSSERAHLHSVPWGAFSRHPAVWALVITHFCQGCAFWNVFAWLPMYFEEHYPGSKKWVFNVLPWLLYFPVALFVGRLADYMIRKGSSVTFVRKFFQTLSMCGGAMFMILINKSGTFSQALFCMMMAMSLNALGNAGSPVTPQDMSPKYAGTLFGIMNSAGALSGIVGTLITGHILEVSYSWKDVFNLNAVVLVFGAVVFLVFGTAKKVA